MDYILEIKNLHTYFYTDSKIIKAVEGLNLSVKKDEILGLVGESGCGKTVSMYSVLRLLKEPAKIVKGEIIFNGIDLLKIEEKDMQKIRGKDISIIFQEPTSSLDPLFTIGYQLEETIKDSNKIKKSDRRKIVFEFLRKVKLDPEIKINSYPFRLSGGEAQRVVIAIALINNPKLIIADEPTTSLDVTVQANIIKLLKELKEELRFSMILITHNLALCYQLADRIAIMYAGRIIELASSEIIFKESLHPYTKALLACIPNLEFYKEPLYNIPGGVPDPAFKPSGCFFNPRCPFKLDICELKYPDFIEIKEGHFLSCHLYGNS
mgnify:CR=1 FL=1